MTLTKRLEFTPEAPAIFLIDAFIEASKKDKPPLRVIARHVLSGKKANRFFDSVHCDWNFVDDDSEKKNELIVHWIDKVANDTLPKNVTKEYFAMVSYRAIDSYMTLPAPEAIRSISTLLEECGHIQQYASRCIFQLVGNFHQSERLLTLQQTLTAIPWIDRAIVLEREGKEEQSLDIIFDTIDEMLLASKFDEIDSVIPFLPISLLTKAQLITILTATLPARSNFRNREKFFNAVKATLKEQGDDAETILAGLE